MLRIKSLSVAYGASEVLSQISLDVKPAEVMIVIGPNGAGKSTMIRVTSGIIAPSAGQIFFNDRDVVGMKERERARLISVVPQATQLAGAFTVEQAVGLGRTAYVGWLGALTEQDQQAVSLALEQTELSGFRERRIADLSGGEQQRVMVARALAQDCPVMMLDEPTSHLDLQHQTRLLSLVKSLAKEKDLVVLITLHDLNLAALYADRVALLVEGRLQAIGNPHDVLTAANIENAYHTPVEVSTYAKDGRTLILPVHY